MLWRTAALAQMLTGQLLNEAQAQAGAPASQPAEVGGFLKKQYSLNEVLDYNFWRTLLTHLADDAVSLIPRIFVAVLFLFLFWLLYRGVRRVVLGGMSKAHVDSSIRDMLVSLIKWSIMGFGIVIAFNQVGIQITALLTGVSIIGLAIGFAAQETLSNFIAGVVIFWDKPFRVGDWIEVDTQFGQVLRITFRSTRMLSTDGDVIVMPNTAMLSTRVANHSAHPVNRIRIPVGIAYKERIDHARRVLIDCTVGDTRICADPPASVVVTELAASSVNVELRFWISDESLERKIHAEYLEKAKEALDAAGIEIPFPHTQLVVDPEAFQHLSSGPNLGRLG